MNPLMLAQYLGARIYSAELTAAAWLEQRRAARRIMLGWYHRVSVAKVVVATSVLNVIAAVRPVAAFATVPLVLAGIGYSLIADKSHEVLNEEDRPCHLCPAHNDDDGDAGGVWLGWDGDQPPAAPPPMDDLDDDRIRAMAGDIDAQHAALIQESMQ